MNAAVFPLGRVILSHCKEPTCHPATHVRAFVIAAAFVWCGMAAAQEEEWATYHNARFGTTADYPARPFHGAGAAAVDDDGKSSAPPMAAHGS